MGPLCFAVAGVSHPSFAFSRRAHLDEAREELIPVLGFAALLSIFPHVLQASILSQASRYVSS